MFSLFCITFCTYHGSHRRMPKKHLHQPKKGKPVLPWKKSCWSTKELQKADAFRYGSYIYIYMCVVQSYSSNCYCIGKQTATMCLFWSIWCVVCSTAILISCFFTQNLSTCACGHANDLWIDVSSVQSLVEGGIPMIVCKNPSEVPWNHC